MADARTHVTFKSSAFNTSETKPYFVTPDNYGDDVARWLLRQLRRQGLRGDDSVGQEDYGWYFTLECEDAQYTVVVTHRGGGSGEWVVWIERSVGVFASLYKPRTARVLLGMGWTIHEVLTSSDKIHDVLWHYEEDFLAGQEELGQREPA